MDDRARGRTKDWRVDDGATVSVVMAVVAVATAAVAAAVVATETAMLRQQWQRR